MTATLAGIWIHPVKSAAGIACETAVLGPRGLAHDREWMIVDPDGRFLTQRDEARLALLATAIEGGCLKLANPQGPGPSVALDHGGEAREVIVWRSQCAAFDAGKEAAQFLSEWLGRPLRLVRFDARRARLANHDWTGGRDVPTAFSDGYPLLVLSQASIDDLSARIGRRLPVERFRPNLLLDGVAPYAEDQATTLATGEVRLALTKACTRCVITTVDPQRGVRDGEEPLATLKTYRHDRALRGVVFGRNAYALEGDGATLQRGMPASLFHH
jgi:uncharacterized protein YcbX